MLSFFSNITSLALFIGFMSLAASFALPLIAKQTRPDQVQLLRKYGFMGIGTSFGLGALQSAANGDSGSAICNVAMMGVAYMAYRHLLKKQVAALKA